MIRDLIRAAVAAFALLLTGFATVVWYLARRTISSSEELRREIGRQFELVLGKLDVMREHVDAEVRTIWHEIRAIDRRVAHHDAIIGRRNEGGISDGNNGKG